jgi:hypothetical protein
MSEINPKLLRSEERIVWTEEPKKFDYVREIIVPHRCRRGAVYLGATYNGRIVGYAELRPDAQRFDESGFLRRVFTLTPGDRDSQPRGPYKKGTPSEAIDPRTVAPGVPGKMTDRAWDGLAK